MDIINSNHLRVTCRTIRRECGEQMTDAYFMRYHSADHGKARRETTLAASLLGLCVDVKWRPDGKR